MRARLFISDNSKLGIWTLSLVLFIGCGFKQSAERRQSMQNLNLNEPILEQWLVRSQSVPDNFFAPADAVLLFEPLQQSKGTMGVFLKEEVDPYRGVEGVRWMAYAADPGGIDLLRSSEYVAAGLRFVITESRNFVIVKVTASDANATRPRNRQAYLTNLIQTVVNTETTSHRWQFALPTNLDTVWEGRLISNQGAPPISELQSRHDRADILILNDTVHFLFYKKVDQLEDFPPEDAWFGTQARAALRAGRTP